MNAAARSRRCNCNQACTKTRVELVDFVDRYCNIACNRRSARRDRMSISFRCIWIYRVSTRQVLLTRAFPTVEHRHRSALVAWAAAEADVGSDGGVGRPSNSTSADRLPTRRTIERLLTRALGARPVTSVGISSDDDATSAGIGRECALPVVDLGGDLRPVVAVFRPGLVFLALPLVPVAAVMAMDDACAWSLSPLDLPEVTAAATIMEMLADHAEPLLRPLIRGGGGSSSSGGGADNSGAAAASPSLTVALVQIQAHLSLFLPLGSPVEVGIHQLLAV
jgi:hypothetical protein